MADASDLNTWDCLWNGKYKDNMIMINSVRDAFTPALRTLGYSINETDTAKLDEAFDILNKQSSDVLAYYVDETCDEMVAEMRQSQCATPVRQLPPWLKTITWTISCQRRAQTSGLTHGLFQRHARIKRARRNFELYLQ